MKKKEIEHVLQTKSADEEGEMLGVGKGKD